jgi:hypothetical protein
MGAPRHSSLVHKEYKDSATWTGARRGRSSSTPDPVSPLAATNHNKADSNGETLAPADVLEHERQGIEVVVRAVARRGAAARPVRCAAG